MVAAAVIGTAVTVAGSAYQADQSRSAANKAKDSQVNQSTQSQMINALKDQQNQWNTTPFINTGIGAVNKMGLMSGMYGNEAQQNEIDSIKNSAQYDELNRQGQNAILQNASATGGLRGGNVQAALAQFSPALLNQLITTQYGRFGNLASLGQNTAVGYGSQAQNYSNANANIGSQISNAQAGAYITEGKANSEAGGQIARSIGSAFGKYGKAPSTADTGGGGTGITDIMGYIAPAFGYGDTGSSLTPRMYGGGGFKT